MSNIKACLTLLLYFFFISCNDNIKFTNKKFTIKGTSNEITIQVPAKCEQFSSSVKESLDFLKVSAKKDQALKNIYDKADLISEFSERIQAITIAQCKINQQSNVYDPDFSDQVFYSELVKSYVEFQKWKDLKTGTTATTEILDSAINRIYSNMYNHKNEELSNLVNDMAFSFNSAAGSTVVIYVNGRMACATAANSKGEVMCVVPKKYLLPIPNEITYIKIVATAIGFTSKELNYSLGEAILKATNGRRINIDK
jgi:hypothetical protein